MSTMQRQRKNVRKRKDDATPPPEHAVSVVPYERLGGLRTLTTLIAVVVVVFALFCGLLLVVREEKTRIKQQQQQPTTTTTTQHAPNKPPLIKPEEVDEDTTDSFTVPQINIEDSIEQIESDVRTILSFGERHIRSPGHLAARNFIVNTLKALQKKWTIEFDNFTQTDTPIGEVPFYNIIATLEGNLNVGANSEQHNEKQRPNRIIFAAHYESKIFSKFEFLAATDSALPCAILLELARYLSTSNTTIEDAIRGYTIQLIFFDGEESIREEWTTADSLYGSKHLAQRWQDENQLKDIELFVLLDLVGAAAPNFYHYDYTGYKGTHFKRSHSHIYYFQKIMELEQSLRQRGAFETKTTFFQPRTLHPSQIQDDHTPFLDRGVTNILHMIAMPFPSVWHTTHDNLSALHWPTIHDVTKLLKVFITSLRQ